MAGNQWRGLVTRPEPDRALFNMSDHDLENAQHRVSIYTKQISHSAVNKQGILFKLSFDGVDELRLNLGLGLAGLVVHHNPRCVSSIT